MNFFKQEKHHSINNALYSTTFKMNFALEEESEESECKNINNLLNDIFPYFEFSSVTTVLVLI